MTATDTPPAPPAERLLRRSRTQRVGAGVAGGLGDYFGVDPVLFRVLFATSAFFGGAGIIAYLLAWAAIPEQGAANAPIDGWIAALRRRRVPVWAVALAIGVLIWLIAFSWWAPGPFLPVIAIVIVLVAVFARRDLRRTASPTVDLTKAAAAAPGPEPTPDAAAPTAVQPPWVDSARDWVRESREAARRRRARALPVRLAVITLLVLTIVVLGVIDSVTGIALPVYFWAALAIVGGGLLVGALMRSTPWSVAGLLPFVFAGLVAFAGTHASLHDGTGQRDWRPGTAATQHYKLAFGQATLDLRHVPGSVRRVDVTLAAGQVKIVAPRALALTVDAHLRFGRLVVDGTEQHAGVGLSQTVDPPATANGTPLTVDVHLEEGEVALEHR